MLVGYYYKLKGLFIRFRALTGVLIESCGRRRIRGQNDRRKAKAKCEKGVLRCVFDVRRLLYRAIKTLLGKILVKYSDIFKDLF